MIYGTHCVVFLKNYSPHIYTVKLSCPKMSYNSFFMCTCPKMHLRRQDPFISKQTDIQASHLDTCRLLSKCRMWSGGYSSNNFSCEEDYGLSPCSFCKMRVSSLDEEIIPSKYLTERFLGEQERKQTIYEESRNGVHGIP